MNITSFIHYLLDTILLYYNSIHLKEKGMLGLRKARFLNSLVVGLVFFFSDGGIINFVLSHWKTDLIGTILNL